MDTWVLNWFLYFPEDKTQYIPAAIEFFVILGICIGAFVLIRKLSKKQEMKTKELEERIMQARKTDHMENQPTK